MWFLVLLYSLALLGLIIFGLISYARWNFGSLEKLGIPVVKPHHFLLGSALLAYEKPGAHVDIEHMKKYGPIFGFYNGREPQIVICDPELIRLVTTKDAEYFDAKRPLDFGDKLFNEMMEFQLLEKWKFIRNMITPVLSSSVRLKTTNPAMTEAINDFVADIKKQIIESEDKNTLKKFAVDDAIFGMLTDLIARSQYSIRIGKSDLSNRFVQLVRTLMSPPGTEAPWLATYVFAFPFLQKFLPNTMINPEACQEFGVIIKQIMEERRKQNAAEAKGDSPTHQKDFLDNVLEWYDNLETPEYKKHDIIPETIWNLALGMFIGGQDQISLILGVMFYYISENPEMEKKLHDEVDKVFASLANGKLEHENLSDLTYLSACINEATRLHPFFFRTERECTKDWENTDRGIKIKKGMPVIISLWGANRNPEYLEDPEEYKPERFMPGNKMHPYAFTSFGFGNRGCAGKRMAMEMMLLLAAYLVKEFRFVKRDYSKLQFLPAGLFFSAHEPIHFDVELRNRREE